MKDIDPLFLNLLYYHAADTNAYALATCLDSVVVGSVEVGGNVTDWGAVQYTT